MKPHSHNRDVEGEREFLKIRICIEEGFWPFAVILARHKFTTFAHIRHLHLVLLRKYPVYNP